MPIGAKVTLRGDMMYEFLDRLISVALPRVRDFRGLNNKGFDGNGNYTLGIKEQIILDSLLNENELKIEGVEINAKMDEQIRQMFYLPEDAPIEGNEQLMAYRKNMMGNQEYINYTVEMIRREKLVKLFEEKVKFCYLKIVI